MNKILTLLFICIITFSYSQHKDSIVAMTNGTILEVESYNLSRLYLTQNFIDSLDLHIWEINLSFHSYLFTKGIKKKYSKLLKETHCLYIETKAVIQIDEKIITKKRKREKELEKIQMEQIKSIIFINKYEAKEKYGWWRGRHGAIIIETKQNK